MSRRYLTPAQSDEAERQLQTWRINPRRCPVCRADPDDYEAVAAATDHHCGRELSRLFHQATAGLNPRHMAFDWDTATPTPITRAVNRYLENFDDHVRDGKGLVFLAANYGSGKTQALVQIVKHALDHGYSGRDARMISFHDVISSYQREDADAFERELHSAKILAIDEIIVPKSEPQAILFERFADVVDARYVANRPIFLAGNISPHDLERHYPKVFSRLHSMVDLIEVPDLDFRQHERRSEANA